MDYYEELGLERSATELEIRQAYRSLARVLHPDRCPDEESRRQADRQMKRLNQMLATLVNPAERQDYDRCLFLPSPAPGHPTVSRPPLWFWMAGVFLALICMMGFSDRSAPKTQSPVPVEDRPKPTETAAVRQPGPKRARRHALEIRTEQPQTQTPPSAPSVANGPAAVDDRPTHISEGRGPMPPLEPPPSSAVNTMAGEWLFVPPANVKSRSLYRPEYIELRIVEDSGLLRGRYRARYHIPDQAISPSVAFQFRGPASNDAATIPWESADGSDGEVTLQLSPVGTLEVKWVANHLGRELGLISGTATLVRKLE